MEGSPRGDDAKNTDASVGVGRGRASESIYNVSDTCVSRYVILLGCRISTLNLSPADDPVPATPRNDDPCITLPGCESIKHASNPYV